MWQGEGRRELRKRRLGKVERGEEKEGEGKELMREVVKIDRM